MMNIVNVKSAIVWHCTVGWIIHRTHSSDAAEAYFNTWNIHSQALWKPDRLAELIALNFIFSQRTKVRKRRAERRAHSGKPRFCGE